MAISKCGAFVGAGTPQHGTGGRPRRRLRAGATRQEAQVIFQVRPDYPVPSTIVSLSPVP